jgi:hypothetical protein
MLPSSLEPRYGERKMELFLPHRCLIDAEVPLGSDREDPERARQVRDVAVLLIGRCLGRQ